MSTNINVPEWQGNSLTQKKPVPRTVALVDRDGPNWITTDCMGRVLSRHPDKFSARSAAEQYFGELQKGALNVNTST